MPPRKVSHDDTLSDAMAWIAYYRLRRPNDYSRALRGLPALDEFTKLANVDILMQRVDGKYYLTHFPLSLNSSRGARLLEKAAKRLQFLIDTRARQCVAKLEEFESLVIRRKDTKDNLRMLATSILHRAAIEGKTEVIFSYDSLRLHMELSFKRTFLNKEIKTMLLMLDKPTKSNTKGLGFFSVRIGESGRQRKFSTRIETLLDPACLSSQSEADEFLDRYAHAMDRVYLRETEAALSRPTRVLTNKG